MLGGMSMNNTPEKGKPTMKIPPKTKPSFYYQPTGPPDPMTVLSIVDRWGLGSATTHTGGRGGHTWQVHCEFIESF